MAVLALSGTANAGILFSNLGYGSANGQAIDGLDSAAASFSTDGSSHTLADVILSLEQISSGGHLTVGLYSDSGSQTPGSSLVTPGTIPDSSLSVGSYSNQTVGGGNYALAANTRYWVVLTGTSAVAPDAYWNREQGWTNGVGLSGQYVAFTSSGGSWFSGPLNADHTPLVMQVDVDGASTPEPSTVLTALAGLGALAVFRYRSRRTA